MMLMLDDFEDFKRSVKEDERAADQAAGAYAHLKKRLKVEFKCRTVEEAEALLESLKTRREAAVAEYLEERKKYERLKKKSKDSKKNIDTPPEDGPTSG